MKNISEAKLIESEKKECSMLFDLGKLFYIVYSQEKITGSLSPSSFIRKLKNEFG